jgi:hydroxymethylpyrimidine pyrophosphatase-like HAD family hydrolase
MPKSYLQITPGLARRIKLIVADVDGTLLSDGDKVSPAVARAIRALEAAAIMVGFDSGRPLTRLEPLAAALKAQGPVIAENGCVAKLKCGAGLYDLGYSRDPALKALTKFKANFPQAIREAFDYKDRLIDVGFFADDVPHAELLKSMEGVQLLDSGYMLHMIQNGVSKGKSLKRILGLIGDGQIRPDEVMVFGDSATDISLFTEFENSVLVINPRLPKEQTLDIRRQAKFQSKLPFGDGFVEVVSYLLRQRSAGTGKTTLND